MNQTGQRETAAGSSERRSEGLASRAALVTVIVTAILAVGSLVLQLLGPDPSPPADVFGGVGGVAAVVLSLCCAVVGAVVMARLPENRIGWLFCLTGVTFGASTLCYQYADAGLNSQSAPWPLATLAATIPGEVGAPLIAVSFLLFPDGRLPARRWWPALATMVVTGLLFLVSTLRPGPLDPPFEVASSPLGIPGLRAEMQVLDTVGWVLTVVGMVLAGAALAFRLRGSRGVERQQLKLVLTAGAAATAVTALVMVTWFLWPEGGLQARMGVLQLSLAILPAAAGVSILRYRLYDIDVVINRTLVYGALTITLAAAYIGIVLTLQLLLKDVTGKSSLAVAASTLAVAALFRPARSRIQRSVDRRFYRRRYDARRTVESFAARLRDQVDLDAVRTDLRGSGDRDDAAGAPLALAAGPGRRLGRKRQGPRRRRGPCRTGVNDGTRTRDILDHNQVLYQLSYAHHDCDLSVTRLLLARATRSRAGKSVPVLRNRSDQGLVPRPRVSFGPLSGALASSSTLTPVSEPPCSAARALAAVESGPGGGTNTAAR